jgi:hypothetical protein
MLRQWHSRNLGLALGVWILAANPCWSGDLSTQPFEVRLWSAMSRSISSTDAIGRQASVAYLSASSDNPAGTDLRDVKGENAKRFFCAGTHHIVFSDGAWIAAADVNGFFRLNNAGTLLLGYNHIGLLDGQTRQGFEDDLSNNEFAVKYGRKINSEGYVGVGVRVRDMELNYGDLFLGAPRNTHDDSIAASFTLGGMWRPNRDLTLGMLTEFGWIGSDIEGQAHMPGFDAPFRLDLTTQTVNVKTGLGWKILPMVAIYADGQYFHIGNSMTTVDIGRFYFGGDIRVAHGVSLMAGGSVDNMAQTSVSAGISITMSKPSLLKVTYQHNPLPELHQEFGTGNLVSASVVFSF